jgi:cyclic pyranopterin phosphate synthase
MAFADQRTLSLQLGFNCNNRCEFCIASAQREAHPGKWVSLDYALRALAAAVKAKDYRKVIITGGEVTLHPMLPRVLRAAKRLRLRVQVQTNGRRLADRGYAKSLLEAGADEFFVSVHGDTARLHERLTRSPGSFAEMEQGLSNLKELGAGLVTNTVIVAANHKRLPQIARYVVSRGVTDLHFWFITPTGMPDKDSMIPPLTAAAPPLRRAILAAEASGASVMVKYFPICLLGSEGDRVDNIQPFDMVAAPGLHDFLRNGWKFGCPHAKNCPEFPRCGGLTREYARVHGTQEVSPP